MRTTLSLDDDVVAEVERLRREEGLGLSEAVNCLIRRGIMRGGPGVDHPYVHVVADLGAKMDVSNIAEVLDLLDGDSGDAG